MSKAFDLKPGCVANAWQLRSGIEIDGPSI
jgi:hypothetical protein